MGRRRDREGAVPSGRAARLRARNLATLAVLAGLAVLFFAVTIVKFGGTG